MSMDILFYTYILLCFISIVDIFWKDILFPFLQKEQDNASNAVFAVDRRVLFTRSIFNVAVWTF